MSELTLKHFILKQRVLDLYRQAIRASRGEHSSRGAHWQTHLPAGIPDKQARKETMLWIRGEFERNRNLHDTVFHPLHQFSCSVAYDLRGRLS